MRSKYLSVRVRLMFIAIGILVLLNVRPIVRLGFVNALRIDSLHTLMDYIAVRPPAPDEHMFFIGQGLASDVHSGGLLRVVNVLSAARIVDPEGIRVKDAQVLSYAIRQDRDMEDWLTANQMKASDLDLFSALAIANHQFVVANYPSAAYWYEIFWDRLPEKWPWARERLLSSLVMGGKQYLEQGQLAKAEDVFRKSLEIKYNNLQSLYRLEQVLSLRGKTEEAEALRTELRYFTLPSTLEAPEDWGSVALALLDRRIWGENDVYKLTSLLDWRGRRQDAQNLVVEMLARFPNSAIWHVLNLKLSPEPSATKVDSTVSSSMEVAAENAQIYLVAGEVLGRVGHWKRAAELLERYHQLRPADLRGTELLVQAYQSTGDQASAFSLQAEFDKEYNESTRLTSLLGQAQIQIQLGQDILANGAFGARRDQQDQPDAWQWLIWPDDSFQQARFFVGGLDYAEVLNGLPSVRIQGVWTRDVSGNIHFPRAVFRAPVQLAPGSINLLTFGYRTDVAGQQKAAITVVDKRNNSTVFYQLAATDGDWVRASFLILNPELTPLDPYIAVMNYGIGDVWFQQMHLRRVETTRFSVADWQRLLGKTCPGLGAFARLPTGFVGQCSE